MKPLFSILLASIFILTTSCNETKKAINTASNVQLNGDYTINTINEKNYTPKGLVLTFDALNKAVNATTDCNSMFGNYTIELSDINFASMASTRMYCEGEMDAEKEIGQALAETGSFTQENGVLTLFSKKDRSKLLTATKIRE